MKILDEDGNLFGRVNVIDAAVVVIIVMLVFATVGAVLSLSRTEDSMAANPSSDLDENYVTVVLNRTPEQVAAEITRGDSTAFSGGVLNVTDVYRADVQQGIRVTVRARITVSEPPRIGQNIKISTKNYRVGGQVTNVSDSQPELNVTEVDVVYETVTTADKASQITVGDTYAVAGQRLAVVETVDVYPESRNREHRRVIIGLKISAITRNGRLLFKERPVSVGENTTLWSENYRIDGEIVYVGATERPGKRTTRTGVLTLQNVDPRVAESLVEGMAETNRGTTTALIREVAISPAKVILTSEDGEIFERSHPRNKDVRLTVQLRVRQRGNTVHFHGKRLRTGDTVILDLGLLAIEGTVSFDTER